MRTKGSPLLRGVVVVPWWHLHDRRRWLAMGCCVTYIAVVALIVGYIVSIGFCDMIMLRMTEDNDELLFLWLTSSSVTRRITTTTTTPHVTTKVRPSSSSRIRSSSSHHRSKSRTATTRKKKTTTTTTTTASIMTVILRSASSSSTRPIATNFQRPVLWDPWHHDDESNHDDDATNHRHTNPRSPSNRTKDDNGDHANRTTDALSPLDDYHNPTIDQDDDEYMYEQMKYELMDRMDQYLDESFYCRPEEVTTVEVSSHCVSLNWHHDSYPNCNIFHEISMISHHPSSPYYQHDDADDDSSDTTTMTLLGRGTYRSAYVWKQQQQGEEVVWKQLTYHDDIAHHYKDIWKVRIEALMMERLTSSSSIANIYGYCATSTMVERGYEVTYRIVPYVSRYQKERGRITSELYQHLDDLHERLKGNATVLSFNKYTALEKLQIVIAMAEAIAEQHGYVGGVLVNDDVHPDQWLISQDGRYILNDMNNAKLLHYDMKEQTYCPYYVSYGGDFRSPEEYIDGGSYVAESVDIWPMGNLIYTLLTGLYPYYHLLRKDRHILQQHQMDGIPPYINPKFSRHSYIERQLVAIMNTTFVVDPQLRPSIFDIVRRLRHVEHVYYEAMNRISETTTTTSPVAAAISQPPRRAHDKKKSAKRIPMK